MLFGGVCEGGYIAAIANRSPSQGNGDEGVGAQIPHLPLQSTFPNLPAIPLDVPDGRHDPAADDPQSAGAAGQAKPDRHEPFIPLGGVDTELFFPGGVRDRRNRAVIQLRNGRAAFINAYQPGQRQRFQWPRNIET
jgi:hypothetical protein